MYPYNVVMLCHQTTHLIVREYTDYELIIHQIPLGMSVKYTIAMKG